MSLTEERMQILKMLEQGKITAEEAAALLAALEASEKKEHQKSGSTSSGPKKRRVRISVTDEKTGKKHVNVNIPFRLAKVIKKIGAKFSPEVDGLEIDELLETLESENVGKIVDVQDDADGKRVEIFVE
jgi:hypothetical protein